MGKVITHSRVATYDRFEEVADALGTIYEIKDHKLYIGESGGLYLVTTQEWVDFLIRDGKIPTEPYSTEELPDITTSELMNLIT